MIGKFFDKLLAEDEELIEKSDKKKREKFELKSLKWPIVIFLFAFIARLVVLFIISRSETDLIGDVFHHWQIAYLSKTVGFKNGFLRLWDFKGMEYYWGLLHPLILIIGFIISGSISILVPQIISIIFSSLSIMIIFLIIKRHFNKKTAFAGAVFLSLLPTALFHDILGLQEPIGIFFLVLGIYVFSKKPFAAGFSWMLAGMVRSEYWIFGAGLLVASLIRSKKFEDNIAAFFGYIIPAIFYMKYLLNYTGNAIYSIYWNFLAIGKGEWARSLTEVSFTVQAVILACKLLVVSFLIVALVILWKKFRAYLLLFLGFIYLAFVFSIFGFSNQLIGALIHYYAEFDSWQKIVADAATGKMLVFPEGFLGILVAILLFYFLPKKLGKWVVPLSTLIFLAGLVAVQFMWVPIKKHYSMPRGGEATLEVARVISSQYTGEGTILLTAGSPRLTYYLAYDEGISGEKIKSSFYGPFYYYEGEDAFADWDSFREEIIDWLEETEAELFVVALSDLGNEKKGFKDFGKMLILEEGKLFKLLGEVKGYKIYEVQQ